MVFCLSLGAEFLFIFRRTSNFRSPAPHRGHPGPIPVQYTTDLWWTAAAGNFSLITLAFLLQYNYTNAPYTYPYTYYSYRQEKWTKPESLPKRKDRSDNREHLI